jgi:hypothetical protein
MIAVLRYLGIGLTTCFLASVPTLLIGGHHLDGRHPEAARFLSPSDPHTRRSIDTSKLDRCREESAEYQILAITGALIVSQGATVLGFIHSNPRQSAARTPKSSVDESSQQSES